MLAYTYISPGKFELIDKPKPELQGPRDAIVRITLGSICTSDLHIKHGSVPRAVPGITVGHEMVGVVEKVGSEVRNVKAGDRVTVNVETFCGECFFCQNGFVNNCTDPNGGWALGCRIDGGQAEYVRVPYADQAAFNPMNIIDGIGFSPDKMLQGRLFSYGDAQRYRLGVNHHQIPVNRPRCPFHSYHRDGQMRTDDNAGRTIGYEPNSYGEWHDQPHLKEPPLAVSGEVYNYDERELDSDYYTQPGKLWRLMSAEDQRATCENTARAMGDAELFIKQRHIRNCHRADPTYGEGVAKALGLSLSEALTAEDPAHPKWDWR